VSAGPELATHVATALGLTVGTTVFYDVLPEDAADGSVGLMISHPRGGEHDLGHDQLRYEFPMVQALVRHRVQASCLARLRQVIGVLVAITDETLSGTRWLGVTLENGPAKVKKDANERWLYGANFAGIKDPS
jgi:minor capsid protein